MSACRRFWCLLLLAAVGSAIAATSDASKSPNIILITIDTTRADRVGFLGSRLGLTPNLDAVASEGAVFTRAYAQVPLTTPSHATMLTGTYPQFNRLGELGTELSSDLPYLPALLHGRGYTTAAFVGSQVLDPKSAAAPGFNRGFDVYDAGFHRRGEGEDRYSSEERRAMAVVGRALAWLKRQPRTPFFLWVHLYDAHDPYEPPEPFKSKYAASPYDGEIAYVDSALGKLFSAMKASGLYDSSIIAIAADHGEAFGEHGEESHGFFLYDETIHVPLAIKLPKGRHASPTVSAPVSLVDLAPTLLRAIDAEVPGKMQGKSLLALVEKKEASAESSAENLVYAETDYPASAYGWSWLRSLRSGKYLYIDAPHRELYDLSADPQALHNLAAERTGVADTLQTQLDDFRRKTSRQGGAAPAKVTPQMAEKLQALGYVSSMSNSPGERSKRGEDPKDKIEIANLVHRALLNVDDEHYQTAIPLLARVLNAIPQMALANQEMGIALNGLEKYSEAIPYLRKALELNSQSGRAHLELGEALGSTGDWAEALQQFEAALAHSPESDDLHYYLGLAYENLGRGPEAEKAYRDAIRINPRNFRATLFLGRLYGMQNQSAAALPFLQKAAKLDPQSPDVHRYLAIIYNQLGQNDAAQREQAEANRLAGHP